LRPTLLLVPALFLAAPLAAQHAHGRPADAWAGAQAIPLLTHVSPAVDGAATTELDLSQPMLMGGAALWSGRIQASAMLNLEALTLPDGEPTPGIWGEGFVDRRHPHTLLHEATITLSGSARGVALSVTGGRGFVPFGSDDPMARPFAKYPLNHHLAQVLERLMVVGAVRAGPAVLEAALFNGDEPTGTASLGSPDRLGDSWSVRGTVQPLPGLEVGVSHARLASPEQPSGGGLDHRKTHASLRWERSPSSNHRSYALLEWSRTEERNVDLAGFRFHTALAEGAVRRGGTEVAARLEQTQRPDEERLVDPFRTPFPHGDVHLLGISRWRVATLALSHGVATGPVRGRPFIEASRQWVRSLHTPSAFVPREFYGSERLFSIAAGARLSVGAAHGHRPGRYGAASQP